MITLNGFLSFSQMSAFSAKQDLQYECSTVHINSSKLFSVLLYIICLPKKKKIKFLNISEPPYRWKDLKACSFFSVFCFFACQVASLLMPLKPNFTHYMEIHSASSPFYSVFNTPSQQQKKKVIEKYFFLYHPYFVLGLATFQLE